MNTSRYHWLYRSQGFGLLILGLTVAALLALYTLISPLILPATAAVIPVQAGVTFVVNSAGDLPGIGSTSRCDSEIFTPGDQCTLRAALRATNATPGTDTITFNLPPSTPGCDSTTGQCVINLFQPLPDITDDVIIQGPGADKLTVHRSGASGFRIFTFLSNGLNSISGLTITGGDAGSGIGGGISNEAFAALTVQSCVVTGNVAWGGGGIANGVNASRIDILNSVVSSNTANGLSGINGGGGILAV
ncbi:MAG TPA: hypothetical protein VLB68_29885, partial [Pyrinomonadaceae bacterium]|nr:hypothetical protein [Pyrinomonadaceae bacterium]